MIRRAVAAGLIRLQEGVRRDDGQSLSEYGLILVLISIVSTIAMEAIGIDVIALFADASGSVDEAVN